MGQVADGTARLRPLRPDSTFINGFIVDGHKIVDTAVLEYFLARQNADGFDAGQAKVFSEKMRRLVGWNTIDYTLQKWFERAVRDAFLLETTGKEYTSQQQWVLRPDVDLRQVDPQRLEFACWIGVGYMKWGASYDSISATAIFDTVTTLGSDLPARLKKYGSGELPSVYFCLLASISTCAYAIKAHF